MESLSILWAVFFLIFGFFVLIREKSYGRISKYLFLYCTLAVIFEILNTANHFGWLAVFGNGFSKGQRIFGVYFLSIALLAVSYVFFKRPTRHRFLVYSSIIWATLLAVLTITLSYSSRDIGWSVGIVNGAGILGWSVVYVGLGFLIFTAYVTTTKSLHKNRIALWGVSSIIIFFGDIFLLVSQEGIGGVLRIAGTAMLGYVVFYDNLIYVGRFVQRLPFLVFKTLVAFLLYLIVLVVKVPGGQVSELGFNPIELTIRALILVLLVNPLLYLFERIIERPVLGKSSSSSVVAREYNLAIAQIVDLHHLASVALDEIIRVFQIRYAQLYLVDRAEKGGHFILTPVLPNRDKLPNTSSNEFGKFELTGPVVDQLNQLRKPLLQYDLDFSPKYFSLGEKEKDWLSDQQMDIFFPICTLDTWIGVFGLGPKKNGERFFPHEIDMLSTIAEQTVIVLQNVRLIEELRNTHKLLDTANDKLKILDETKTAFISVVSHELRTPLANIGFSLQLLEMYGKDHLLPEQIEQMDLLDQSVRSAREMVDNLITYASFLNEKLRLNLSEFEFREQIHGILEELRKQAENKGLRFYTEFPGTSSRVLGDHKLLTTAVYHLVSNAIKYTQSGSIWVTSWVVEGALCFDVQDTGIGIPSGNVTNIWDAFTQVSSDPVKRGVEGLGLGLALVKMIIQAHGGFVWVESKHNTGSFFGFQIPLEGPGKPLDQEKAKSLQLSSLERSANW